jgi:predicted dehydrogenase
MSARWTAAIIGCGRIAGLVDRPAADGPVSTHAQAWRRRPDFSLAAVCDPCADRVRTFREAWGVAIGVGTIDALLEAGPFDVVSVCSGTAEHFDHVRRLLADPRGPRVVFAEKPVCTTPQELADLFATEAASGGRMVLVNHTRRFDPAHRHVAALVRSGVLGPFAEGRADYYGGWLHNGSHLVDTLRMCFDHIEVDRAEVGAPGKPGDPCLEVRLLAGGGSIDLHGVDETCYQLFDIDLRFACGRVQLRQFGEQLVVEQVAVNAIAERYLAPVPGAPWRGLDSPLRAAVDSIAGHLDGRNDLATNGATLADAAKTMKVLWQAAARA